MELKRVVVTGIGAVSPLGNSAAETWQKLLDGVSGAAPITHFDATQFKTQFACELKGFKAENYIDRKEARKMDPYCHYAMAAASMAMDDSAIDLEAIDKNRVGVVFGVGIGGMQTFEDEIVNYALHKDTLGPKFSPFFVPKMIADICTGQISIKYGFHGPNYITSSACASSTNALADAFNLIRLGKANVIVSGGAEAAIIPEDQTDVDQLEKFIGRGFRKTKNSSIVIVTESPKNKNGGAMYYAERVKKEYPQSQY